MSDAEKRLAEAQTFITAGKFDEAEAAYRAILTELPEEPEALRLLGYVYLQRGLLDAARDALYKSAEIEPAAATTWAYIADLHAARRQPKKAFAACENAIKVAPGEPEPVHHMALIYYRFRVLDKAKEACEASLRLADNLPGARQLYGAILFEVGEFEEALAQLARERNADNPLPDPNAWYAKSLYVGNHAKELAELAPASDIKQRHVETVLKATSAWQDNQFNEAAEFLDEAQLLSKRLAEKDSYWTQRKVLEGVMANRKLHPELYEPVVDNTLLAIGDSLALCASGLLVASDGQPRRIKARSLTIGRFRRFGANAFRAADQELEVALRSASESKGVLYAFTEFNFRRDRQVLPGIRVEGDERALEQLSMYVERALTSMTEKAAASGREASVCNLPHQIMIEGLAQPDREFLDRAVRHVNKEIAKFSSNNDLRVVDLFEATSKADGSADRSLYFFENFPRPAVLAKALAKAYT